MGDPVQGVSKDGSAQKIPAVLTGGVDGNGAVRTFLTDTSGRILLAAGTVDIGEVQILGSDGLTLIDIAAINTLTASSKGIAVALPRAATGTVTSPASVNATGATVLAANAARIGATVWNESGAICYLKLGSAGTLTSYTVQVASGAYYETPYGYTGILTGITVSGTAVLRVTELT